MISFDRYKEEINLYEFILNHGFKIESQRQVNRIHQGKTLRVKNDSETLLIFRNKQNHHLYYNVHNSFDKGSIFDFCKRKLSHQSFKETVNYLDKWEPTINIEIIEKKSTTTQFSINPEPQLSYLSDIRKIDSNILHNPIFQGVIGTYNYKGHSNTAYLLVNQKKQPSGVEMKSARYKGALEDSQKASSLWLSHNLNNNKILAITENPIDAISHYELFGQHHASRNITYASTCGSISEEQIQFIDFEFKNENYQKLLLLNDNDFAGIITNLYLIIRLGETHNNQLLKYGKNQPLEFHLHLPEGANTDLIPKEFSWSRNNNGVIKITAPYSLTDLIALQYVLTKLLNKGFISIQLPVTNDFNDDLKETKKKL